MWAAELVRRKASFDRDCLAASTSACSNDITELATDANSTEHNDQLTAPSTADCSSLDESFVTELERLPPNYVVIRH